MKRKRGTGLIALGLALLLAAAGLTGYNLLEDRQAAQTAESALQQLQQTIPAAPSETTEELPVPDYVAAPGKEMPVVRMNGRDYVGTLSLPTLGLELPVISRCTSAGLRAAPCRYTGSAYTDDLVIAAHNYTRHFGRLRELQVGDAVIFTDFDGNVFTYAVGAKEILPPDAVEEMTCGEWDLSLFTCTPGGANRVTVRCDLAA